MEDFIVNAFNYMKASFESIFTKLVVAIIILLVGFILGRMVGKILLKVLNEIELNAIIHKATGIKVSIAELISKGVTYFIYFIFIIAALEKLNISAVAFNLLAGGVIIIIIISIFLGIKDFIPNMIGGIYITQKRYVQKGDRVKVDNIQGTIREIQLNTTKIETQKGDIFFIPNSVLVKSKVVKLKSSSGKARNSKNKS